MTCTNLKIRRVRFFAAQVTLPFSSSRPALILAALLLAGSILNATAAESTAQRSKNVAAIVTEYRHNSHADIIVSRLLKTDTLDGKGNRSPLKLVSLYTDQVPKNDLS